MRRSSGSETWDSRVRTPVISPAATDRPAIIAAEPSGSSGKYRHPAVERSSQVRTAASQGAHRPASSLASPSSCPATTTSTMRLPLFRRVERAPPDLGPLFGPDKGTPGGLRRVCGRTRSLDGPFEDRGIVEPLPDRLLPELLILEELLIFFLLDELLLF